MSFKNFQLGNENMTRVQFTLREPLFVPWLLTFIIIMNTFVKQFE